MKSWERHGARRDGVWAAVSVFLVVFSLSGAALAAQDAPAVPDEKREQTAPGAHAPPEPAGEAEPGEDAAPGAAPSADRDEGGAPSEPPSAESGKAETDGAAEQHDGEAIQLPELDRFVEAVYPAEAKARGLEAVVVLALTVSGTGDVTNVTVVQSAGHGFDEAATAAAYQFRFRPAKRGGAAVAARILFRYAFKVERPAAAPSSRKTAAVAPTSAIYGTVVMAPTGTPIAGASVEVLLGDGTRRTALTGEDGSFELVGLPAGRCHVLVQSPGLTTLVRDFDLAPHRRVSLSASLQLAQQDDEALEVIVAGERQPALTEHRYSRRELESMPGTLGDAMRAVQNLPGVAAAPLGSAELVVRGMGPLTNLVFVDGLYVLNAYHLWGISSIVPTEMLDALEFYPGNYGVEYGRGLGSMIELRTRRAASDGRHHGLVQLDLVDSRLMLEGPVPGLEGWSFIGGARRSHLDQTLMPVFGFDVSPVYYDYQAFLETRPSRRSRLRLGIFGSQDRLRFREGLDAARLRSSSAFWYALSRYDSQISDELLWQHTLAFGYLRNSFLFEAPTGTISADTPAYPLALRTSLTWQAIEELSFRLGTDVHYAPFDATLDVPDLRESEAQPGGGGLSAPMVQLDVHELYFRPAAFFEAVLAPTSRSRIVAGVRGDYSHDTEAWDTSPRLRASYTLGEPGTQTKVKAGVGLFHQPPQPEEVLPGYGSTRLSSSRAVHTSVGVEQRLFDAIDANLEAYYFKLTDLVERAAGPDGQVHYVNSGAGYTYGLETLLRYNRPNADLYGWIAYTLARSLRRSSQELPYVLTDWDQTHIMTALGSVRLGRGWEFGARFQYASGMPYTPVVRALYNSTTDAYVPVLGARNSERYPAFHQLDLRVEKHWQIDWLKLTAYLDVLNLYSNRRAIDIQYNEDYSAWTYYKFPLPMIPSIGLRGEF